MAKMVDISLLGDKALQRKLQRLPYAMQKKIVRPSLREAARPMLATAKAIVPVETGRLKKSLKLRAMKVHRRDQFGVVVFTGKREELGIPADDKSYYPMSVEYGHGGPHPAPAHPFLRPAFDANKEGAKAIIAREIGQRITTEARKP